MKTIQYTVSLLGLLAMIIFSMTNANANEQKEDFAKNCQSAREFITTHKYLDDYEELGLNENQKQRIAHKVSLGCTGSAKRFIHSLNVLLKAEAAPRGAMEAAIALSQKSQSYTDTFVGVFKISYLKKNMDLDFSTSFRLAENLSTDYKGDVDRALEDFEELTEFCLDDDVGLSKTQCALMAGRVAKAGEGHKKPIWKAFRKAFKFIQSGKGPQVNVKAALTLAEDIVKVSPHAVANFIQAYRYGVSNKGLKMTSKDSLNFAKTITNRTVHNPSSPLKINFNRLPASLKKSK